MQAACRGHLACNRVHADRVPLLHSPQLRACRSRAAATRSEAIACLQAAQAADKARKQEERRAAKAASKASAAAAAVAAGAEPPQSLGAAGTPAQLAGAGASGSGSVNVVSAQTGPVHAITGKNCIALWCWGVVWRRVDRGSESHKRGLCAGACRLRPTGRSLLGSSVCGVVGRGQGRGVGWRSNLSVP